MKKLVAMMLGVGILAGSAQGDVILVDFDDADAWDLSLSNAGTYGVKSYAESGWSFSADDSIRETTADRFIGVYAWRMNDSDWLAENTTEATYSGFSLQIRPWTETEPSSANPFTLSYSVNSGVDWVHVATIGGVALEWASYGATFDEQTFSASQFKVRIETSTTTTPRMNIDNFTAIPEPGTLGLLAFGLFGVAAVRRQWHC